MKVLGCILLLSILNSIDARTRMKRVIGGNVYDDGNYKYHVSLWYMGENNPYTAKTPELNHTCGGSLIGDQWVLTSAVCFDDTFLSGLSNTSLWKVVLGMYDQRGSNDVGTFVEIDSVFQSPDFNLMLSYGDIALLKLTEKVTLGDRIDVVGYNTDPSCPSEGQESVVIGWGQTQSEEYGLGSDFPYEAVVYPTSVEYCKKVYAVPEVKEAMGGIVIDDKYICAGRKEGGVDGCYGDSGSPLVDSCNDQKVITGIMSTGYGCAQPGFPGVYTRISAFSDWITKTMTENS